MGFHSGTIKLAIVSAVLLVFGQGSNAAMPHSAGITNGFDPLMGSAYSGTSNPSGNGQINVLENTPGYLNDISGGLDNGASGQIDISDTAALEGAATLLAIAIHVTDSAGSSHSLSSHV